MLDFFTDVSGIGIFKSGRLNIGCGALTFVRGAVRNGGRIVSFLETISIDSNTECVRRFLRGCGVELGCVRIKSPLLRFARLNRRKRARFAVTVLRDFRLGLWATISSALPISEEVFDGVMVAVVGGIHSLDASVS